MTWRRSRRPRPRRRPGCRRRGCWRWCEWAGCRRAGRGRRRPALHDVGGGPQAAPHFHCQPRPAARSLAASRLGKTIIHFCVHAVNSGEIYGLRLFGGFALLGHGFRGVRWYGAPLVCLGGTEAARFCASLSPWTVSPRSRSRPRVRCPLQPSPSQRP